MALETPNALHAGIVAFYALPGTLPAPNDGAVFVLTAAEGIADLSFPPSPPFSGDFTDGLLLELQEPVNPAEGIYFCNQLQVSAGVDFGLTPLLLAPGTGNAEVDDFAASNGNWMALAPTFSNPAGFLSVSIFELPQVDDAELPVNLPISS
jgi:hypothetical protein